MAARTEIELTMLFTRDGAPAQDINTVTPGFPTVRIWDVTGSTSDLVVDSATMNVVVDGPENDGFYKFIFTNAQGFDENKRFVCLFNAGTSVPAYEQYLNGSIFPDSGNEVLDGQTGINNKLDDIATDIDTLDGKVDNIGLGTTEIDANVTEILNITTYLRKFESNRTQVDVNTGELLVFDDDCTTVLWKFRLLDETGQPNVESVAERLPIVGGAGPWSTCGT